uniref:Uncharacterized protein n=1 Tax=Tetraselmis sp. GSL018 TaxID=582737 RepID=A0A061S5B5_9CHLO|mmetsp:Transcript_439/g.943  ORF Transcript_439/g.943 Transcript_439/m.943 type:complete len:272 (+) Transcript_439:237-1052(+)
MSFIVDEDGKILQHVLAESQLELLKVARDPTKVAWLNPCVKSAEGSTKVYEMLQCAVESEDFLERLARSCRCGLRCRSGEGCRQEEQNGKPASGARDGDSLSGSNGPAGHPLCDVCDENWWAVGAEGADDGGDRDPSPGAESKGNLREEEPMEGLEICKGGPARADLGEVEGFVLVDKEEVIESIAVFVARYVVSLPEARQMEPKDVQRAVANAFAELRMGRIRRLWTWARYLYRCAALGYSALSLYQHPWIVAAVLRAVYTSARLVLNMY